VLARRRALHAVAAATTLLIGGCQTASPRCTAEARFSLVVTVVDASGKRVCNASVTARDGTFSAVLHGVSGPGCTYFGVPERKGTYSLSVRDGTTNKTLDGVKVSADACHVHPRGVTVALDH
jgi:hypothetical protein